MKEKICSQVNIHQLNLQLNRKPLIMTLDLSITKYLNIMQTTIVSVYVLTKTWKFKSKQEEEIEHANKEPKNVIWQFLWWCSSSKMSCIKMVFKNMFIYYQVSKFETYRHKGFWWTHGILKEIRLKFISINLLSVSNCEIIL